ncbi:MAG TPA: corrinoid protein [Anaerovoracaceae bacterium]|nr:corrinoid protein [Anaerovoracaceae bacterium]
MAEIMKELADSLLEYAPEATVKLVHKALDEGYSANAILKDGLIIGMDKVGDLFKNGDVFLPEVFMSAECLQEALTLLKPLLKSDYEGSGNIKIVIGTVEGDLHDIGKNLVATMLEGAGFKVVDIGTNVPAVEFIKAAKEHKADVIGCSALLTTTMPVMPEVVYLAKNTDFGKDVKIIFGGAPVFEKWSLENGADGYSEDATSAVRLVKRLFDLSQSKS